MEALQRGEHREGSNGLRNNSGHEEQQNKLLRTPSKEVSIFIGRQIQLFVENEEKDIQGFLHQFFLPPLICG